MRKLSVFNLTSLDGYYKGPNGEIDWHKNGPDLQQLSEENLSAGNMLLFGRVTYDLMASFWPTPQAKQSMPVVAQGMNNAEKIVFSRTLKKADWNNTIVVSGDIAAEITELKQTPGKDMTILGSGDIITQLAEAELIDEYQVLISPVAIGAGTPLFVGISRQLDLRLISTRAFKSGHVLLCYQSIYK